MNTTKLLILLCVISIQAIFAQKNNVNGNSQIVKGSPLVSPQIQVIPIKDSINNRQYELYIELPEDYSDNTNKTYPVLYYTDAVWHREILSACQEYILEDVILVGISWQLDINEDLKKERGAHVSRFRDYSISKHSNPEIQAKYQMGQAKTHLGFIRDNIIKYVENTYRSDPNSLTYFGYSLSGEFGAYILMTQPDTFNNYIIGSPTIKDEVDYLSKLNAEFGPFETSNRNSSLNANVFISYGSLEKEIEPIDTFVKLLKDRRDGGLAVLKEVIDGTHGTAFPTTAIRSATWLSSIISPISSDNYDVSFWDMAHLNNAFVTTTPEDRKDGILVDTLAVNTKDRNAILTLSQEIFEGTHGSYDAVLVSHKNKLVFESYYKKGRINVPHGQASAVKAYTSLVLGRAIQMGYLSMEDLNKPLISFLKNIDPKKFAKGAEKITLHKALTMQGGLTIDRDAWKDIENDSVRLKGQGLVQTLLEQSEPITSESQTYLYGNFNPMLVMMVIDAVVPGTAEDFIRKELLDKLGITNYKWSTHISGIPEAGWRASIMSRDMIKLGNLVLNKGKLNGEQLISVDYLDKATSGIVKPTQDWMPKDYRYGYFWYQTLVQVGDNSYDASFAWGGGGQRVIVIEELDLTIVISGHDSEDKIMTPISEIIIPSFVTQ
ncbi:CubicO group peptidase, beta-lactamase class C family [Aquimarina amphilecti]|uniref:CubicO group peptidase, beta-lactamase class C family n=1 Tax=Aquimarina amphilecti TaxID=1038014 RepID=A0A1H7HBW1_AQUAM|nr:serine hydrolase [Aquimarina amphilecti]SEK45625.1 CubicO group peptidase, beta-lactamase class C family [Aquimarina amphilecti]